MNETDRDLRGAKLSKCLRNSELYKETRLSEEERWSLYERLEITAVKVEGLIFFILQNVIERCCLDQESVTLTLKESNL